MCAQKPKVFTLKREVSNNNNNVMGQSKWSQAQIQEHVTTKKTRKTRKGKKVERRKNKEARRATIKHIEE